MAASWLDLPREIWLLIFRLLSNNLFDVAKFSATCSAFRSIESSDSNNYHLSRPLLLMPRHKDSVTCDLFSLAPAPKRHKRVYKLHLPELQNRYCYGSSYGWIFTLELNSFDWNYAHCSLLNPVNRLHIPLPPLPLDGSCFIEVAVKKAVILADPSKGNSFVVILIWERDNDLSFCRHGDRHWTHLSNHGVGFDDGFHDVTSHVAKFYAVTKLGKLVSWDHCDSNSAVSTIIYPTEEERGNSMTINARYLVNSTDGELLMVCEYFEYFDRRFSVFKLEKEKRKFVELERLGDDQALFLSPHCAFCISALSSAHFLPNYIYSSEYWFNSVTGCLKDDTVYAYNLDDKIYKRTPWKRIYNRACARKAPCIWIMPGETLISIALNMLAKKAKIDQAIETLGLGKMCGLRIIGDEDEFLNKFIDVEIREIEKWGKGKRNDFPQFVFAGF